MKGAQPRVRCGGADLWPTTGADGRFRIAISGSAQWGTIWLMPGHCPTLKYGHINPGNELYFMKEGERLITNITFTARRVDPVNRGRKPIPGIYAANTLDGLRDVDAKTITNVWLHGAEVSLGISDA